MTPTGAGEERRREEEAQGQDTFDKLPHRLDETHALNEVRYSRRKSIPSAVALVPSAVARCFLAASMFICKLFTSTLMACLIRGGVLLSLA